MNEHQVALGKTAVFVTPLGIGAWAWGDKFIWQYGKGYAEPDVRSAFDASIAAGIDFFDTAEVYGFGVSERLLGQFIRESKQALVIATKFAPLPWRWRQQSIVEALRRSLRRLGVKRVDLYQIHFPLPPIPIETWMAGLADAVQAGLTRAVGISNYSAEQTRRAHAALAKRGIPLATNQVEYSLLDRNPERSGLVETCRELGVTIIAYSPIAMGMLTGKYTPENPPPGARSRQYNREYLKRIQPLLDLMRQIGQAQGGKTTSQVALNWLICKGTVPIPGAKNAQQAQENAGALSWRLKESEIAALDAATDRF
jgi:aryl-alcohol dehydrogenase-like predicted oxidoreductase